MVDESAREGHAVGRPFGLEGRYRPLKFRLLHVIEFTEDGSDVPQASLAGPRLHDTAIAPGLSKPLSLSPRFQFSQTEALPDPDGHPPAAAQLAKAGQSPSIDSVAEAALDFGLDSMIVFRDVHPLSPQKARKVKSWMMRALVRAARGENLPRSHRPRRPAAGLRTAGSGPLRSGRAAGLLRSLLGARRLAPGTGRAQCRLPGLRRVSTWRTTCGLPFGWRTSALSWKVRIRSRRPNPPGTGGNFLTYTVVFPKTTISFPFSRTTVSSVTLLPPAL